MWYKSFIELTNASRLNNRVDKNRFHRMGNHFVNVSLLLFVFPPLLIRSFVGFHRIKKSGRYKSVCSYIMVSFLFLLLQLRILPNLMGHKNKTNNNHYLATEK
jgi:hypothetical protein